MPTFFSQHNENKERELLKSHVTFKNFLPNDGYVYRVLNKKMNALLTHITPLATAHYNYFVNTVVNGGKDLFANLMPKQTLFSLLSGGFTNITYRYADDYVVRFPGIASDGYIDRSTEYVFAAAVSKTIGPELFYFDKQKGIQVTGFIKDALPMCKTAFKDLNNIRLAAKLLHKLHQMHIEVKREETTFARNRQFEKLIKDKTTVPEYFSPLKQHVNQIENIISKLSIEMKPCHNDTTPPNFIRSGDEMRLIDYEYAALNDPVWDLANVAMDGEFPAEQIDCLLRSYCSLDEKAEIDPDLWHRFNLYKPVVEYYTALWARLQLTNKNYLNEAGREGLINLEKKRLDSFYVVAKSEEHLTAIDYFNKKQLSNQTKTGSAAALSMFSPKPGSEIAKDNAPRLSCSKTN